MATHRPPQRRDSIKVDLTVRHFASGESLAEFHCISCDGTLDFHQPDPDLPNRMLGTCDACKSWHLLGFVADGPGATLSLLPVEVPGPPGTLT